MTERETDRNLKLERKRGRQTGSCKTERRQEMAEESRCRWVSVALQHINDSSSFRGEDRRRQDIKGKG